MNVDAKSLEVTNNQAANRFEVKLGDKLGLIAYKKHDQVYVMTHTEVPPEYGGQGVADRLTHEALEMIKADGYKVQPDCPFVAAYIRRHKEYQPLVVTAQE